MTDPPEGFALRGRRQLAASTLRKDRPNEFAWHARRLRDAGADTGWVNPGIFQGGDAGAMLDRGLLLIAERGRRKLYRLTASGVARAQEVRR